MSDEEIEFFLHGDRREIDRLILLSINRIAAALIPHTDREKKLAEQLEQLGGMPAVAERARFVDALIDEKKARNGMMLKIAQSSIAWALPFVLGFVAVAVWDAFKRKIGG